MKCYKKAYMDNLIQKLKKRNRQIAVLSGLCLMAGTYTGCGFVSNPMQYMKDADESLIASEQASAEDTQNNQTDKDDSGKRITVTDNKVVVIGTYGSISDMVNADDYKSVADIECVQETRDFDDTSDMLALVKKVREICETDAESVIVSVRGRVYNQIIYLLEHTINTTKGLIVICEDDKNIDYKKTFADALNTAVDADKYQTDNSSGIKNDNNSQYTVVARLSDMDIIDISDKNSLPYVSVVYDYIGNDAYTAEKAVNSSEAVVVVTDSKDGSLSPAMTQLVNDISSSMPVVIVNNAYNPAGGNNIADSSDEYNNCILASGMNAEQARIMAMLCLVQSKNIDDWRVHFNQKEL